MVQVFFVGGRCSGLCRCAKLQWRVLEITSPKKKGSESCFELTSHGGSRVGAAPPGPDVVVSPYELTVDGSMRDFWCSAFHSTNRLVTSMPFAQRLGFTDRLLPFDLMLFLTGAMAHADRAVEEVAFVAALLAALVPAPTHGVVFAGLKGGEALGCWVGVK